MAITVTPNLTLISNCEATTGWSGGSIQDIEVIQGTYALGDKVSQTTSGLYKYDLGSGGTDFTGKLYYQWLKVGGIPDTKANGGYRMYVEDTSGNYGYWYVGGSDTVKGWTNFVVDPSTTPTTASGTINVSSIRYVGVQFKVVSKALGNNSNAYWDICRYGTGLKVTSLVTDTITIESIYAVDSTNTNAYGIIEKLNGVYFLKGGLEFGDTSSGSINFEEDTTAIVFVDADIQTGIYEIKAQGNASGTTNVTFSGCYIAKGGDERFDIQGNESNVDVFDLLGNTIVGANTSDFSSITNITDNVFDDCNLISPGTSDFTGNVIKNSTATRALKVIASHNISDCQFIDNVNATWYDTAGTYSDDGNIYSGNTKDIENSSTGLVTVNVLNGGNASTYTNTGGGTTAINNTVALKITILDAADQSAIQGARVYVVADTGGDLTVGTVIFNALTDINGEVNDTSFDYTNDQPITGRIRKGTTTPKYKTSPISGTIISSGYDSNVFLVSDE